VCVVGKMRDLILQLSKSSIYSTKPELTTNPFYFCAVAKMPFLVFTLFCNQGCSTNEADTVARKAVLNAGDINNFI
ncbi:hypothetical protein N5I64_25615, partial [Klebsiella quasipneumoniae]|nr:hypothetical protein [Klebsiella quasipneumoniae]